MLSWLSTFSNLSAFGGETRLSYSSVLMLLLFMNRRLAVSNKHVLFLLAALLIHLNPLYTVLISLLWNYGIASINASASASSGGAVAVLNGTSSVSATSTVLETQAGSKTEVGAEVDVGDAIANDDGNNNDHDHDSTYDFICIGEGIAPLYTAALLSIIGTNNTTDTYTSTGKGKGNRVCVMQPEGSQPTLYVPPADIVLAGNAASVPWNNATVGSADYVTALLNLVGKLEGHENEKEKEKRGQERQCVHLAPVGTEQNCYVHTLLRCLPSLRPNLIPNSNSALALLKDLIPLRAGIQSLFSDMHTAVSTCVTDASAADMAFTQKLSVLFRALLESHVAVNLFLLERSFTHTTTVAGTATATAVGKDDGIEKNQECPTAASKATPLAAFQEVAGLSIDKLVDEHFGIGVETEVGAEAGAEKAKQLEQLSKLKVLLCAVACSATGDTPISPHLASACSLATAVTNIAKGPMFYPSGGGAAAIENMLIAAIERNGGVVLRDVQIQSLLLQKNTSTSTSASVGTSVCGVSLRNGRNIICGRVVSGLGLHGTRMLLAVNPSSISSSSSSPFSAAELGHGLDQVRPVFKTVFFCRNGSESGSGSGALSADASASASSSLSSLGLSSADYVEYSQHCDDNDDDISLPPCKIWSPSCKDAEWASAHSHTHTHATDLECVIVEVPCMHPHVRVQGQEQGQGKSYECSWSTVTSSATVNTAGIGEKNTSASATPCPHDNDGDNATAAAVQEWANQHALERLKSIFPMAASNVVWAHTLLPNLPCSSSSSSRPRSSTCTTRITESTSKYALVEAKKEDVMGTAKTETETETEIGIGTETGTETRTETREGVSVGCKVEGIEGLYLCGRDVSLPGLLEGELQSGVVASNAALGYTRDGLLKGVNVISEVQQLRMRGMQGQGQG